MPTSNNRTHPVRPGPHKMGSYKESSNSYSNSSAEEVNGLRTDLGNTHTASPELEGSGIEDEDLLSVSSSLPEHNNATETSASPLVSTSEAIRMLDEKGSDDGDLEFLVARGLPHSTEVPANTSISGNPANISVILEGNRDNDSRAGEGERSGEDNIGSVLLNWVNNTLSVDKGIVDHNMVNLITAPTIQGIGGHHNFTAGNNGTDLISHSPAQTFTLTSNSTTLDTSNGSCGYLAGMVQELNNNLTACHKNNYINSENFFTVLSKNWLYLLGAVAIGNLTGIAETKLIDCLMGKYKIKDKVSNWWNSKFYKGNDYQGAPSKEIEMKEYSTKKSVEDFPEAYPMDEPRVAKLERNSHAPKTEKVEIEVHNYGSSSYSGASGTSYNSHSHSDHVDDPLLKLSGHNSELDAPPAHL